MYKEHIFKLGYLLNIKPKQRKRKKENFFKQMILLAYFYET